MPSTDLYDQAAEGYADVYSTHRDDAESRLIASIVRRNVLNGTVVDVGCGDGLMARFLHGLDYVGIDPSPRMIEVARHRWPQHHFIEGTLEAVNDGTADFVLGAFGPLIHIPPSEVVDFAREIRRVLWRRRRFLVMAATRGIVRATGEPRLVHYPLELKSAFEAAGLTNVRVRGLFWLGRPLLAARAAGRAEWLVVEGDKGVRTTTGHGGRLRLAGRRGSQFSPMACTAS